MKRSHLECKVCGNKTGVRLFYCDEHYKCEDCGTRENLCIRLEELTCDSCHEKRVLKKIEEFNGFHEYMNEVVCPWCGYEHSDSWEMGEGEMECSDCGRPFEMDRDVEVTYSTRRKE